MDSSFLNALDSLVRVNRLYLGPDFYTYCKEHPELFEEDGVHPSASAGGGEAMHRLWAEAVMPLYENPDLLDSIKNAPIDSSNGLAAKKRLPLKKPVAKLVFKNGAVQVFIPREKQLIC